jgi:hypothetical protein
VTAEEPVILDAASLSISRSVNEPNDDRMGPDTLDLRLSVGKNAGDASIESLPLRGGCSRPIDLAMQDITSSLRSNSPSELLAGVLLSPGLNGVKVLRDIFGVCAILNERGMLGLSPPCVVELNKSPGCTACREKGVRRVEDVDGLRRDRSGALFVSLLSKESPDWVLELDEGCENWAETEK